MKLRRHDELLRLALINALAGKAHKIPEGGQLAWGWFNALCRTRTNSGYSPNPLSYAEIEAFARLYRWPMEPRHIDMILALDRAWLDDAAKRFKAAQNGSGGADAPPITKGALSAIFGG
ncbi:hypothetical protein [Devosia sp.]|uniref:phage tail assembly chaperone n=1 Tax=Devosia sp. TaxID=1871048 RepID=UPI001AC52B96|nr:hypothetical protein [Devosia sp.]MBN9335386.1 hypothetical protein [Devosia sp.]